MICGVPHDDKAASKGGFLETLRDLVILSVAVFQA
jgi:hypothetical protein